MTERDYTPDVGTRHTSVFQTRPKRRRAPRLTDGKKHPVIVGQLALEDVIVAGEWGVAPASGRPAGGPGRRVGGGEARA